MNGITSVMSENLESCGKLNTKGYSIWDRIVSFTEFNIIPLKPLLKLIGDQSLIPPKAERSNRLRYHIYICVYISTSTYLYIIHTYICIKYCIMYRIDR